MFNIENIKIGIIGLGYVGLPLAVEFGKKFRVVGFDIDTKRINELKKFNDLTMEMSSEEIESARELSFTDKIIDLKLCSFFIITVPTPIDKFNRPDFNPLIAATRAVAEIIKNGDIIVYESTVYPGATEEICVPIIEQITGFNFNQDFFCGYSPERINPGDKKHRLPNIVKVTSGSTPDVAIFVDNVYKQIIEAGTHIASSIRVAEAAKVIENTQRDLNIALINELSMIFNRLNINTNEVLEAASTKWNFLNFKPGLVGGHCIGVDPYYLTHKAEEVGYHPQVILAGRRINDGMSSYIAQQTVKLIVKKGLTLQNGKILILGLTFKENCPDLRNSKVFDLIYALEDYGIQIDVYDPFIRSESGQKFNFKCLESLPKQNIYHGIILAVAHDEFLELGPDRIKSFGVKDAVLYDVKNILPINCVDGGL